MKLVFEGDDRDQIEAMLARWSSVEDREDCEEFYVVLDDMGALLARLLASIPLSHAGVPAAETLRSLLDACSSNSSGDRLVAVIEEGGYEGSTCTHLIVPPGLDLRQAKAARRAWYDSIYLPALHAGTPIPFLSLIGWLLQSGAREATDAHIEESEL
jgi:hypothetical protein